MNNSLIRPLKRPHFWKRCHVSTWRSLALRKLVESAVKQNPALLSGSIPTVQTAGILGVEIARTVMPVFDLHSEKTTQLLLLVNVPSASDIQRSGSLTTATNEMNPEGTAVTAATYHLGDSMTTQTS